MLHHRRRGALGNFLRSAAARTSTADRRWAPATLGEVRAPGGGCSVRRGPRVRLGPSARCIAEHMVERHAERVGPPNVRKDRPGRTAATAPRRAGLRRLGFVSGGELACPFVSERPGSVVALDLGGRGSGFAVDCLPVRLDDQVRALLREGGDCHDAAEGAPCVECEERATRARHPRFEWRFGHRGIEADQVPPRRTTQGEASGGMAARSLVGEGPPCAFPSGRCIASIRSTTWGRTLPPTPTPAPVLRSAADRRIVRPDNQVGPRRVSARPRGNEEIASMQAQRYSLAHQDSAPSAYRPGGCSMFSFSLPHNRKGEHDDH